MHLTNVLYPYDFNNTTLLTKAIEHDIPANTGVILQAAKAGTYRFYNNPGTVTQLTKNNLLSGTITEISCEDAIAQAGAGPNAFVMTLGHRDTNGELGFFKFKGNNYRLSPFRAYLVYDPDTRGNVQFLSLDGIGENTNGILDMKALNNDDAWYTLQGVLLDGEPSQHGVYIHGGKKVSVK